MPAADDEDVRVPTPWERLQRFLGPPRSYQLTRWAILRLLGIVYLFAFLGIAMQGDGLLGSHGLTPAATYLDRLREVGQGFWDAPSVFWWSASDGAISGWAWFGVALSAAVVLGYANLISLLGLWFVYGSVERVGQEWFGFGWEIQLLETGLIAAFLAQPLDPRPLGARSPPVIAIVLMRWLAFRIMLGAGLIKLRGAACWTELTCLDAHFETQPIPNPLSAWFHHLPHVVHAIGVALNHVAELFAPWLVFGPRPLRLIGGCTMVVFQLVLIASGNLAFLNWLTLVPLLACFDDDALRRVLPARFEAWIVARLGSREPPRGHRIAVAVFAALVAIKSCDVIGNLASDHQAMNRSYDRLALVNTYGAFGSIDFVRHELIIEGTRDADPAHATWQPYELPCKPGDLDRRPCILGPYHRRLDWLIWFAAMSEQPRDAWILHLVWKLLDNDAGIRELLGTDPFAGEAPRWVRIRRFVYHLEPPSSAHWWSRDHEELWLPPVALDSPGFAETLARYGWPSPTRH